MDIIGNLQSGCAISYQSTWIISIDAMDGSFVSAKPPDVDARRIQKKMRDITLLDLKY